MSLSLRVHIGQIHHSLASFNMNFKLWLGMVANSAGIIGIYF